ncbi:MAG: CPBP family intramembrane metalloprotease [Lachnospiraceae bacterium]|nr:CPBP family intramembrane metalloprotease [Lachnospiraceae bacterium]
MSKIWQLIKNISPLNNRTGMPVILYVIKVIIVFWFVKFTAELIGEGFAMAFIFACGKNPLNGEMLDNNAMVLLTYCGYGLLIGVVVLYWKFIQKKTLSELGFTRRLGTYPVGVLIGAALIAVSVTLIMLTGTITYSGVFENIDYVFICLMFGGFIFQGAFEEVLCRGVVLQLLKDKAPVAVAVGVSTVLFVIPHISGMKGADLGIAIVAVVCLILISLILSLLTLRFKSIYAACGLHTAWNFVLYNILGLNLSGNDTKTSAIFDMRTVDSNIINGGDYGIEASVVTAVVLAAALVLTLAVKQKKGGTEYGV